MIVVDASVLANALADDGDAGDSARRELRVADQIAAPDLVAVETASVLRRLWLRHMITEQHFAAAVADVEQLDIERVPTSGLIWRAFELRANVTAYDACYVAVAEMFDCELVTADGRLANAAGPRCPIRLVR